MRDAPAYYADGPEALVVNLAARGDRDAFTELVRRRQTELRTLLRRFGADPELADDLAQEVFLKAWRKIRQLKQRDQFGGWIKQIAVNEWADHQRKHATAHNIDNHEEIRKAHPELTAQSMNMNAAGQDLQDELFISRVAKNISGRRRRVIAGQLAAVLLLVALELLPESPLEESLGIAAEILETSLIPLENEWLAFAVAPINSLAGLLGMLVVGIQYLYRKIR